MSGNRDIHRVARSEDVPPDGEGNSADQELPPHEET